MSKVTLGECRHAIRTNGKRVDTKGKKPLPIELQVRPRKGKREYAQRPRVMQDFYGQAALWHIAGCQPPRGERKARYHVRVRRGNGSYCYRKYDCISLAMAAKAWLALNAWKAEVIDTQVN